MFVRTKVGPFSTLVPFAEQAYDLVKNGCHFTPLSFCSQDWTLLLGQEQNVTNRAPTLLSFRENVTWEQTAAYARPTETSYVTMPLTAQ